MSIFDGRGPVSGRSGKAGDDWTNDDLEAVPEVVDDELHTISLSWKCWAGHHSACTRPLVGRGWNMYSQCNCECHNARREVDA